MPQPQYVQVVGPSPGWMLLEVPCICRTPEEMQCIAATLNAPPEVEDILASIQTDGILVDYNRARGGVSRSQGSVTGLSSYTARAARSPR